MKKFAKTWALWGLAALLVCVLAACGTGGGEEAPEETPEAASSLDYMVLVNKLNPLPEGWEEDLETETFTNTAGWEVEVEKKAYDAYLGLKEDLEAEGVYVDLDSARRSVAKQQEIMDDFIEKYGFRDMYSGGFYPFATPEERWAWWSRHI